MGEHAPMSSADASRITDFLRSMSARQHSTSGRVLEVLQTVGLAARDDYEAKRRLNGEMRRALIEDGFNPAGLPWDLLANTAQPTAEEHSQPSYEPDFRDEARRGYVSLRLHRMAQRGDFVHTLVLRVYFGDIGHEYDLTPLPRVFSLMHLCPSGQALIKAAKAQLAPSSRTQPGHAQLRSHLRFRELPGYAVHEDLFASGEREAEQLWIATAHAWGDAKGGQ